MPLSEVRIVADQQRLHLEIMLNAWELQFFSELDADKNGEISRQELADRAEEIARLIIDHIHVQVDDQLVVADVTGIVPVYNTHHLSFRAHYAVDATSADVKVSTELASITHAGHVVDIVFQRPHTKQQARLVNPDAIAHFPAVVVYEREGEKHTAPVTATPTASPPEWNPLGLTVGLCVVLIALLLSFTFAKKRIKMQEVS